MQKIFAALCALSCALTLRAQMVEIAPANEAGRTVSFLIKQSKMAELRWPDFSDYRKHLRNFYGSAGYELAWIRDGKPTSQALNVIDVLKAADAKGVDALAYDAARWDAGILIRLSTTLR